MARLNGREFSRGEILKRIGDLSQVAGIRMMTLADGKERGVRIADVRTGSGLRFQVSLDRGMDLSVAEYRGIPLAWRSANGDVHPSHYEPKGSGWLRSFPGGLLTGCGMVSAGAAGTDDGAELGAHGRLSNLPASEVASSHRWEGDECVFALSGSVRESALFGENLLLHRTLEMRLGESVVSLRDAVSNEGVQRSPLMMLYHINPGWPLVDEGTRLRMNARTTVARDAEAKKGIESALEFTLPTAGFAEQVYYHDLAPGEGGFAAVLLHNPSLHLGLGIRFRQRELHRFVEWKMMGEGTYVVGLEPSNCGTGGRAKERAAGTLQFLDPGETKEFHLQIAVVEGDDEIAHFISKNGLN